MNQLRTRRGGHVLVSLAVVAVAMLTTSGAAHATAPPTIPDGYVRLVDDTGTITVVVPESWTDVDTAPVPTSDAAGVIPYITASPDYDSFQQTYGTPGVVFAALAYRDDVRSVIDEFGLTTGCEKIRLEPYDDGVFVGLAQVGTTCGTAGTATGVLLAANPADQAFTAGVQIQAASVADEEAVLMVLQTFGRVTTDAVPGSAPPDTTTTTNTGVVPGVSVPTGLGPVEVATMFLTALAAGDGATACALLAAEEMTINFVEDAATCATDLSSQVAGQGEFWASVQITGDEDTSSQTCDEEDPADDYVSLELQGPTDDGCLSIGLEADGEWRIEDLSNSIWNQAG
jgi:hypothetical protein